MIESVQVRHRGAYDFDTHYSDLCQLQSDVPLPAVRAHLGHATLDLNGDKVRAVDWVPILNTLKINKSLEKVAFRSFYKPSAYETDKPAAAKRKIPAVRSKEITYRLSRSLKECLGTTTNLGHLEIQGIPLRERDLLTLTKGIMKNQTLNHFSVDQCRIGDAGMDVLSKGLKTSTGINSINFSGCCLSWKGAELLAQVIKHQAMTRHNDAWRDSLRYRRPDLDRMPGIRRITVNTNPLIGDQGAMVLAEVLKDDLWLKALDLQSCGISTTGAKGLLDVLQYNTTMVILDLRTNPLVDNETIHSITEQLLLNNNEEDTQYQLIELPRDDPPKPRPVTRRRRTKTLNSNFGRKTTIKVASTANRRRTRSVGSVNNNNNVIAHSQQQQNSKDFAWRTAARANRLKGLPPNGSAGSFDDISSDSAGSPRSVNTSDPPQHLCEESGSRYMVTTGSHGERSMLMAVRDLKVENEQLKRQLRNEAEARARGDERIVELTIENSRLRNALMESKKGGLLDDDHILESIEASFKQFHSFLDLLRDAGFSNLANLANVTNPLLTPSHDHITTNQKAAFNESYHGNIHSATKIDKTNNVANITFRNQITDPTMKSDVLLRDTPLKTDDLYTKIKSDTHDVFKLQKDDDFEAKFFKSKTHDVDMSGIFPVDDGDKTLDLSEFGVVNSTEDLGNDEQTPTNKKQDHKVEKYSLIHRKRDMNLDRNSTKYLENRENVQNASNISDVSTGAENISDVNTPRGDLRKSSLQDVDSLAVSYDFETAGDNLGTSREGPAQNLSQISIGNYGDSFDQSYLSERGELIHLGDDFDM